MKTFDIGDRGEDRRAVRCCLCGSDRYRPYLRSRGFTFVKCRGCGLVYQNPQPAPEGLHERYGERYFRYELENDRNFFSLMQLGLQDIGFYDIPMDRFDNDRFLDVGCATGMLVEEMQNRGWDARGVEICRESARFGIQKRGVRIFAGTLEEAGFADGEFAVVHFSHLIEHVADPLLVLAALNFVGRVDRDSALQSQGPRCLFVSLSTPASADGIESQVRRHPVQPAAQIGQIPRRALVQAPESLQRQILRLVPVADQVVQRLAHWRPVLLDRFLQHCVGL